MGRVVFFGCLDGADRTPLFFFQAEDGTRDVAVTGVQTCALPIWVVKTRPDRLSAVDPHPDNLGRGRTPGDLRDLVAENPEMPLGDPPVFVFFQRDAFSGHVPSPVE